MARALRSGMIGGRSRKCEVLFLKVFLCIYLAVLCLSWASLVAQLVKNPPGMQETLVRFLGWEDPLQKGWATHFSILGRPLWLSW